MTRPADPGAEWLAYADSSSGSALPVVVVLVLVAGGAVVSMLLAGRRRSSRMRAALEEVVEAAEQDVTALGEDIAGLAVPPGAEVSTAQDFTAALDAYDRAKRALTEAQDPLGMASVTAALEEGRWRMECVRARLAGAPPPQRRPPCFFNPVHGTSAGEVEWAPVGGMPRTVPACAADVERLAIGAAPEIRQVRVGATTVPYFEAPGQFSAYSRGFFSAE